MGTASTMACMAESLGMTLPSNAAIPGNPFINYSFIELSFVFTSFLRSGFEEVYSGSYYWF